MVALSEILQRFRFHGVPGAAAPAGVPVDRTKDIEDELAPVFAALDDVQRRAEQLLAAACRDGANLRATALEEAGRVVTAARDGAAAARADAVGARLAVGQRERERLLLAGRDEAERVGRVAEERMPALTADALARVLGSFPAPARPEAQPGAGAALRGRET